MTDFSARRTMMVDTQVRPSDVTSFPIIEAMLTVPREVFVPGDLSEVAYVGDNLDIGGRVMLAPRTFSKMLDALALEPGELVLDVGCGLGYSAAVLAQLCDAVVAVEDDAARAAEAQRLLSEGGVHNAAVVEAPLAEGAARHGPYDAIILEGAVEEMPTAITDQLKEGGRIIAIFLDGELGVVRVGRKAGGAVGWRNAFDATARLLAGFERRRAFAL
jgi:protein-L-isoaspartate(D-aspartate) O-methyltransferase